MPYRNAPEPPPSPENNPYQWTTEVLYQHGGVRLTKRSRQMHYYQLEAWIEVEQKDALGVSHWREILRYATKDPKGVYPPGEDYSKEQASSAVYYLVRSMVKGG